MISIRCVYQGKPPDFPATDQHPDAVRYGPITMPDGASVWVDAVGGEPSAPEIVAAMPQAVTAAAARLDAHLAESIATLSTQAEGAPKMRGMKRLAFLTQDLVKNMDAEADKVADEIQDAHDRAQAAIGKFRDHGQEIRKVADDIEAALGQLTNDPSQASGGSQPG